MTGIYPPSQLIAEALTLIRRARATLRLCAPGHDTSLAARATLSQAEQLILAAATRGNEGAVLPADVIRPTPQCLSDRDKQTPRLIEGTAHPALPAPVPASPPSSSAPLIELWVRVKRRWRYFESFDPSAPQFSRSAAPADYAWFEAKRRGVQIVRQEPRVEAYEVRWRAAMLTDRSQTNTAIPPHHEVPR
jgi:hypothetical protein